LKFSKVPEATIRRLSTYSRYLEVLENKGETVVSSAQLAHECGVNAAQVRKDLAYFGEFGIRGVGYYIKDLYDDIRNILGLNREWRLAIIGVGNLGASLLLYKDFLKKNYTIVAAFDTNQAEVVGRVAEKVGTRVEILHPDRLKEVAKERKIDIAVIAVPVSQAQKVAEQVIAANIKGILNFTPAQIKAPAGVVVRNVYFTNILDNVVYLLQSRKR
jgi:redox-sensing transcriptional repressor